VETAASDLRDFKLVKGAVFQDQHNARTLRHEKIPVLFCAYKRKQKAATKNTLPKRPHG
jgi:hypothetical protein